MINIYVYIKFRCYLRETKRLVRIDSQILGLELKKKIILEVVAVFVD